MTRRQLASLALAVAAGCATTTGEPPAPPGPPPFDGVRSLVLVRFADERAGRPKDPLDALEESLLGRGYTARVVDVAGRTPAELRGIERLHGRLGMRIAAGGPRDRSGPEVEALGRGAGSEVAALGADAVALYHRFDRRLPNGFPEPAPAPGAFPPPPGLALERRPVAALSLVDRAGNVVWFAWGGAGSELDEELPANPAEAIDALLAVLGGDGAAAE